MRVAPSGAARRAAPGIALLETAGPAVMVATIRSQQCSRVSRDFAAGVGNVELGRLYRELGLDSLSGTISPAGGFTQG
jgi:hypothetical protein